MFNTITKTEIRTSKAITPAAKKWARDNFEYLNKPMKLFGTSLKVEKGADKFETYVMYLQPAGKVAVKTVCAGAKMAGCEKPCLISSGHLGMTAGQNAATKRTILLLLRPDWFNAQLLKEIDAAEKRAQKPGKNPALFRLNGTADLNWYHIISARPDSEFYDYSKLAAHADGFGLANYDVTFSGSMYSPASKRALAAAAKAGHKIAMAYNTKGISRDTLAFPAELANFDKTDLRNLDAPGTLGALTRKGSNIAERLAENEKVNSFFVTAANVDEFTNIIARG